MNRVNELAEIGFEYPMEPDRLYPQGSMAAHVLGFVAPGRGGAMGIERSFNEQLSHGARTDKPVMLSLDARVQAAFDATLKTIATRCRAFFILPFAELSPTELKAALARIAEL